MAMSARPSGPSPLPLCELAGQPGKGSDVRITHLLGRGSSVEEYRSLCASRKKFGQLCAVKSVHLGTTPAERVKQMREIDLHERVSGLHDNIAGLRDCFFDAHHLYIVLNGVFGGDLRDAIAERALFFYDDSAEQSVFAQIVDAVAFCHTQEVFHRDIKPSNILCSMDGKRVFLSNFSLATQVETSEEFGIGTLAYMSPGTSFCCNWESSGCSCHIIQRP